MGLLVLVALTITAIAWWRLAVAARPRTDAAMRVLPGVVGRAGTMARQLGPGGPAPHAEPGAGGSVRILSAGTVQPLPHDAPVPRSPRRRPRARSMTPRAVAARRARARRRAADALGRPLPDAVPPAPIALPRPAAAEAGPAPVPALVVLGDDVDEPATASPEPVRRRRPLRPAPIAPVARPWDRWGRQPSILAAAVVVNLLIAVAVMGKGHSTASPRSVPAVHVRSDAAHHTAAASGPKVLSLTPGPNGSELEVHQGADLQLAATDRAWVRITRTDTGADLVDATLQPGARIVVPVAEALDLRTGAVDALQVTVAGTPAQLPPGPGVAEVQVVPGP